MTNQSHDASGTAPETSSAAQPVTPAGDHGQTTARILILVLAVAALWAMTPFLSGLLGGAVLFVAGRSVHRRLARVIGAHWAAVLCVVGALVLVIGPFTVLILSIVDRVPDTIRGIEASDEFRRLLTLRVGNIELGTHVKAMAGSALGWLSRQAPNWIGGFTRSSVNLLLALFGFYYLLLSDGRWWDRVKRLLPVSGTMAESLRVRFNDVTLAVLLGIALTAVLQGVVVGVGFALVGLNDPVFWGAITACVSVFPVLGSALVWVPGAAVLALEQRYGATLALALIGGIVAANIDNVVRPLVLRRVANLHPFVTLAGAFAGVNVFGLIGLLLGPLMLAFLIELVRAYEHDVVGSAGSAGGAAPP